MTKITHPKEWEQYDSHKFVVKKTSQDKAYQTFLNSITDGEGKLNILGRDDVLDPKDPNYHVTPIPEEIIEMCRVFDGADTREEFIVYDITQWGYFEDGTKTPLVHIQDIGEYRFFEWVKKILPQQVFTGDPQRRQFREEPESFKLKYDIPFTEETARKLRDTKGMKARLYVYDTAKSGRGGKDGKIAVDNFEDWVSRPFKDLMEGTYLLRAQLENEIKAAKQKQIYLDMEKKSIEVQKNTK